jgi:demethoxyubiquinone hydroxylase (CLK1/Coq7/Cat5 family)
MTSVKQLTVFYDGACPLCDREISFYRRRKGADGVSWVDVSRSPEEEVAPGLSKEQALARFHVLNADGTVTSGGAAFAGLWAVLPGFRLLGRLFQVRPLTWALNRSYLLFLKIRPRLQNIVPRRQARRADALPEWIVRDLRSDHAGETGAVAIYRGILALSRSAEIRAFAEAHLKTERQHLALIEEVLPAKAKSLFLPLWRGAGFVTGAVPALFGRKAVFVTIDAVETFVDRHYSEQVDRLSRAGTHEDLRALLERCRLDEVSHRDEARGSLVGPPGAVTRVWCWMIAAGSAAAVAVARRL